MFAERGYRQALMREVAERAGVAEMTLFRHFATKAELFEVAVLDPAQAAIDDYVTRRHAHTSNDLELYARVTDFYSGLISPSDVDDRPMRALAAALSSHDSKPEMPPELRHRMDSLLDSLEALFRQRIPVHGFAIDPHIAVRLLVGMALSVSLRDSLFPAGKEPARDVLVAELAKLTVWGLRGKPH
jgi:AcrR family transcriptional regulator